MSGMSMTPEQSKAWDIAFMVFPYAHRDKFFHDAAKRLAKCTGIPYHEALDKLHQAALGTAFDVALTQIEEVEDGR